MSWTLLAVLVALAIVVVLLARWIDRSERKRRAARIAKVGEAAFEDEENEKRIW